MFMHQPPPAFPFEFPAISMKVIIASQTAAVKAAKQAQALQTAIAVNACSLPEKSMFASGSKNSKQPVILFAMVYLIINHLSATNPAATLQAQIVIKAAITQITQLSNCSFGRTLAASDAAKHKSDIKYRTLFTLCMQFACHRSYRTIRSMHTQYRAALFRT